jgi:anti-sigma regulatory factor (Ser/Thr protein kinase)
MPAQSLTVPATLDSLSEIAAFVLQAAEAAGLDRQAAYRLRLSADEIATNAVVHGSPGGTSVIAVHARIDDRMLAVTIEDSGAPFDPRQVPAPSDLHLPAEEREVGGLGVFLALSGVDDFVYERVEDRNRNILIVNRPRARPGP